MMEQTKLTSLTVVDDLNEDTLMRVHCISIVVSLFAFINVSKT